MSRVQQKRCNSLSFKASLGMRREGWPGKERWLLKSHEIIKIIMSVSRFWRPWLPTNYRQMPHGHNDWSNLKPRTSWHPLRCGFFWRLWACVLILPGRKILHWPNGKRKMQHAVHVLGCHTLPVGPWCELCLWLPGTISWLSEKISFCLEPISVGSISSTSHYAILDGNVYSKCIEYTGIQQFSNAKLWIGWRWLCSIHSTHQEAPVHLPATKTNAGIHGPHLATCRCCIT